MPVCEDIPHADNFIEDVNICDRIEPEVAGLAKPELELVEEAQRKHSVINANGDLICY